MLITNLKYVVIMTISENKYTVWKIFLLCILMAAIASYIDIPVLIAELKHLHLTTITYSIILMLISAGCGLMRWWYITKALSFRIPFAAVFSAYFSGLFTNVIIPGSIGGEILKLVTLHKHEVPTSQGINSLLIDRVGSVISCVIIMLCSIPYVLMNTNNQLILKVIILILCTFVLAIYALLKLDSLSWRFKNSRIIQLIANLSTDAKTILFNPRAAFLIIIFSLGYSFTHSYVAWLLTQNLGWNIDFIPCLIMIPVIAIISALPISCAGWGIREVLIIACYALLGIPKEIALIVSVSYGVIYTISCLPGGICLFYSKPFGFKQSQKVSTQPN